MGLLSVGAVSDLPPWTLSKTMERQMDFAEMLLDVKPQREVHVLPSTLPSIMVASDAQVEPGRHPGGGVLVCGPHTQHRFGGWTQFLDENLSVWGLTVADIAAGKQPIALCEAAMLPLTLLRWPEAFRERRVVWFVDNTAAMAAFVRGASGNPQLERIVALFWILLFWEFDLY